MSDSSNDYGWIGWLTAIVLGLALMVFLYNPNSDSNVIDPVDSTPTSAEGTPAPVSSSNEEENANAWHCIDATSYNQNAYDDNKCTKGSDTRYVSDSQAEGLDPNYKPGKAGASYYNNR